MRDPVRWAGGPSRVERLAGSRGSGLGEAAGVQPLLMCTYGWCGPKTNVLQRRSDGIQLVTEHTFDARAQQGAPGRRQECAGAQGKGRHTGSASRAPQGSGVRCMQLLPQARRPRTTPRAPLARRRGSAGPAGSPSLARCSGARVLCLAEGHRGLEWLVLPEPCPCAPCAPALLPLPRFFQACQASARHCTLSS